MTKYFWLLKK